jgi:hypothetical protein
LTNRTVLLIGAFFGFAISGVVLTLLWFGVAGALHPNATGTDWMYILWPSSVMLVIGWRSTIPGVMISGMVLFGVGGVRPEVSALSPFEQGWAPGGRCSRSTPSRIQGASALAD